MRDMKMFRYGDMMIRNVVDYDKSLFPLVGRTFDRDGIRRCKEFYSKENYKMTIAMYQT
jgi:hypothetical protein